jgi:hypothetical protein
MRAIAILAVVICAGCQPYTFGTVDSGPGGATVLRGEAAAAYRATRSGCARAGFWTVDRRATWADCMRAAGYTVTLALD